MAAPQPILTNVTSKIRGKFFPLFLCCCWLYRRISNNRGYHFCCFVFLRRLRFSPQYTP